MEVQKAREAWEQCLRFIRENVPQEQTFRTWFEPLKFVSLVDKNNERQLTVSVPSQFVYEVIEEHYLGLMRAAIRQAFGEGILLMYRVEVDKSSRSKTSIASSGSSPSVKGHTPADAPLGRALLDAYADGVGQVSLAHARRAVNEKTVEA